MAAQKRKNAKADDTTTNNDILLYHNRRNARLEFRERVHELVSKIVNGSKLKHDLSAKEMLDICYEEFFNVCGDLEDIETESQFCTDEDDRSESNGVFGF